MKFADAFMHQEASREGWICIDDLHNSCPPGKNGRHFGRWQFQMHFLEWKWQNSEICSQEFNWQYRSIGSGNGLAPNRRKAITWTNADPVHWCIYAALQAHELRLKAFSCKSQEVTNLGPCGIIISLHNYDPEVKIGVRKSINGAGQLKWSVTYLTSNYYHRKVPHWGLSPSSSPLGQNVRHFTDDIFRCIYMNEKFCVLIKISLKFVRKSSNENNPALV